MARSRVPIAEGKRICQAYRAPMCVVFTLHDDGETFAVMSYGMTRQLCRLAADYANRIADRIMDGTITPSDGEPTDLPDGPQNWTGERKAAES